ncbi:unnamed protein product, partial [Iphiclides podalirius]
MKTYDASEQCADETNCKQNKNRYSKEINELTAKINAQLKISNENYKPCYTTNCSCHKSVIDEDLSVFKNGILKEQFDIAALKGTKYQIIDGSVYRQRDCHFPSRCAGIEHYLVALAPKLPDMELIINTRDWPQINKAWGHKKAPVFSFN